MDYIRIRKDRQLREDPATQNLKDMQTQLVSEGHSVNRFVSVTPQGRIVNGLCAYARTDL